jgi:hypothetical protein
MAAEDVATGRALRGVGPLAEKFAGKNSLSPFHRKCLDYHQSFVQTDKKLQPTITTKVTPRPISSVEMQKFLEEGKLGEFGK